MFYGQLLVVNIHCALDGVDPYTILYESSKISTVPVDYYKLVISVLQFLFI